MRRFAFIVGCITITVGIVSAFTTSTPSSVALASATPKDELEQDSTTPTTLSTPLSDTTADTAKTEDTALAEELKSKNCQGTKVFTTKEEEIAERKNSFGCWCLRYQPPYGETPAQCRGDGEEEPIPTLDELRDAGDENPEATRAAIEEQEALGAQIDDAEWTGMGESWDSFFDDLYGTDASDLPDTTIDPPQTAGDVAKNIYDKIGALPAKYHDSVGDSTDTKDPVDVGAKDYIVDSTKSINDRPDLTQGVEVASADPKDASVALKALDAAKNAAATAAGVASQPRFDNTVCAANPARCRNNAGLRMNNPANIKLTNSSDPWVGEVPLNHCPNYSTVFECFRTPEEGIRAAYRLHLNYQEDGLYSVAARISRHAPPSENNTQAYINGVANAMGIDPNQPFDIRDERYGPAFMKAVLQQEVGGGKHIYSDQQIMAGHELAFKYDPADRAGISARALELAGGAQTLYRGSISTVPTGSYTPPSGTYAPPSSGNTYVSSQGTYTPPPANYYAPSAPAGSMSGSVRIPQAPANNTGGLTSLIQNLLSIGTTNGPNTRPLYPTTQAAANPTYTNTPSPFQQSNVVTSPIGATQNVGTLIGSLLQQLTNRNYTDTNDDTDATSPSTLDTITTDTDRLPSVLSTDKETSDPQNTSDRKIPDILLESTGTSRDTDTPITSTASQVTNDAASVTYPITPTITYDARMAGLISEYVLLESL